MKNDINKHFGKRLRQLRQMQDMTQEELAEAAGISTSFLGGIERGAKSPTIETIEKLAGALGLTLGEMMSFESDIKVVPETKATFGGMGISSFTKVDEGLDDQIYKLLSEYAIKLAKIYRGK